MFAKTLAPMLARRGIHYGWVMASLTFLTLLCTSAAAGVAGVLILPLRQEFGWDASDIAGPLALRLVLFGLMGPFAAAVQQRYGIKTTVAAALVLILGGFLFASRMTALWQLWLTYGLMVGMGTGLTAMVLAATVSGRWFTARRGLVLGMLGASSATGQLAFLPLAAWLAEHDGWRFTLVPTALACTLAALLMALFGADHPGSLGLAPYGETKVTPPPPRGGGAAMNALRTLASSSRSRVFWILFGTFFVCGLSTNGLVQTHFIPLCSDFGIPSVQAAGLLAAMGIFDIIGTTGSGYLSDRFDSRKLLFWYYGLRGLSLLFLPFSGFTGLGLTVFAVFYGLDWIATIPPTVRLAGQHFGRERAPLVFGWVFTGHQLGAAVAAFAGGVSRDLLDSYLPAFFAAGAFCLVAALSTFWVTRVVPIARSVAAE
jgi:sugar phosphate permease